MIKLFSEEVDAIFTNSDHNIITVESFEEVFFDVFEFEINGIKFIAEKEATHKGSPVISIPVVEGSTEKRVPFLLNKGDRFEVLYNKDTSLNIKGQIVEESVEENILEDVAVIEEEDSFTDKLTTYKEDILLEVESTKKLAEEYAERVKLQKIEEADRTIQEKHAAVKELLVEAKDELLDEFNRALVESRSDSETYNEQKHSNLEKLLTVRIEDNFNTFFENNNERIEEIASTLTNRVESIADELLEKRIDPALESVVGECESKLELISNTIDNTFYNLEDKVLGKVKGSLSESRDHVEAVEQTLITQNVELSDKIKKGVDKALGRIGNIRSSVLDLEKTVTERVDASDENIGLLEVKILKELQDVDTNIHSYYDDKIDKVTNHVEDLTVEQKKYFTNMIEESKQFLLNQIKTDASSIVLKEGLDPQKGTKDFDKSAKKLKKTLEKSISDRFTNEITSLKRLVELSSGGGTVAKQFAAGGVMNGDLTVVGNISAYNYLGLEGLSYDDSLLQASSGNWESTYTTVSANSASWGSAAIGDFCGSVVTMDQLSSCGTGVISISSELAMNDYPITKLHYIDWDLDHTLAAQEGRLSWNDDDGTLDLGLKGGNVNLQLGMEQVVRVKASEDIVNGQAVFISDAAGNNPIVTIASSDLELESHSVIGLATEDINNNQHGYITTEGMVRDLNTEFIPVGEIVYLGTNGALLSAVPSALDHEVRLGYCVRQHQNQGIVYVNISLGEHISNLHDVVVDTPQDKDLLQYNALSGVWENVNYKEVIHDYLVPQTLIDQATVTYDASSGINALLTLTADRTLSSITNAPSGSSGTLTVIQDAVGGHLLTLDSGYTVVAGDITATANMGPNELAQLSWFTHDCVNFYIWSTV
jgi:hypothetical protein